MHGNRSKLLWIAALGLAAPCGVGALSGGGTAWAQEAAAAPGDAEYSAGIALVAQGKHAEAAAALEKFLTAFPKHARAATARLRLGASLLALERGEPARAAFQAVLDEKPPADLRVQALLGLGRAHVALKTPAPAVAPLTEAFRLSEQDVDLGPADNAALGDALLAVGQYGPAAQGFGRLSDFPMHPEAPRASFMVGEAHRLAGSRSDAAAAFRAVAEKYWRLPIAPRAALAAAEEFVALRQYDEAESEYRRVLQMHTESAAAPRAQLGLGRLALIQGKYAVARSAYTAAILVYPQAGIGPEAELRIADTYAAEREHAEAVKRYTALLAAKDPLIAGEARYSLGQEHRRAGEAEPALAAFKALAADPAAGRWSQLARLRVAEAQGEAADPAPAVAALRSVLAEKPERAIREDAAWLLGEILLRRNDFAAAEEQFKSFSGETPPSPRAVLAEAHVARARLELGDPAGAAARAAALLKSEVEPEVRAAALVTLGRAQLRLKQEPAAATLREVLDKHGSSPAAPVAAQALLDHYRADRKDPEAQALEALIAQRYGAVGKAADGALEQAAAHLRAGRTDQAIEGFLRAADSHPDRIGRLRARAALAEAYAAQNKPAQADDQLAQLAKSAPPAGLLARAHAGTARAYEKAGQPERALAGYQAALAAQPDEETAPLALLRAGSLLADAKKHAEAAPLLQELIGKYPRSAFVPDALYELAWRHLSADTPDKARPLFARLVKEFPTHALAADAGFRLGEEEYRAGNYAAAAAHYRPAAEASHPVAEKAGYKLGWSLRRTGDHAGAAKAFAAVAARFPKGELTPESRVRAGEAYLELEQEASALPEFEAVLAREPQTEAERTLALEARVGAAHAYLMKGDFDKARSLVEEAADPAKGWIGARAHMVRAEAIFLKEGAKAALAEYARGAARFGKFPDAVAEFRYRAAECYEKLGNLPLARKTWQRVVELSGETEWAARSREKLKASPAAPKAPAGASLR